MKHKKIKIAALAIVTASLLGGILYSEFGTKKSYDYSDYYVESKSSKTTKENKDNEEASEKELSLSLVSQVTKVIILSSESTVTLVLYNSRLIESDIKALNEFIESQFDCVNSKKLV